MRITQLLYPQGDDRNRRRPVHGRHVGGSGSSRDGYRREAAAMSGGRPSPVSPTGATDELLAPVYGRVEEVGKAGDPFFSSVRMDSVNKSIIVYRTDVNDLSLPDSLYRPLLPGQVSVQYWPSLVTYQLKAAIIDALTADTVFSEFGIKIRSTMQPSPSQAIEAHYDPKYAVPAADVIASILGANSSYVRFSAGVPIGLSSRQPRWAIAQLKRCGALDRSGAGVNR